MPHTILWYRYTAIEDVKSDIEDGVAGKAFTVARRNGNNEIVGCIRAAICAGSDLMHPIGALLTGVAGGTLFVWSFKQCQDKWKIDDVLGVWPLHGMCGMWGGIAAGIFGLESMGGIGGVSFASQLVGTVCGVAFATICGFLIYGVLKATVGIRLNQEQEFLGADLSLHQISAYPEEDIHS